MIRSTLLHFFFFFNDTATTEIYTLSLHDALPISAHPDQWMPWDYRQTLAERSSEDRKSTRLNSSHEWISYAVFCLKKKIKIDRYFSSINNNKSNKKLICLFILT